MRPEFIIVFKFAAGIGFAGFLLMMVSFVPVRRDGGRANALQRTDDGRWPPARRLMLVGEWEMADGSDYVIEFTRDGTMRIRNHAGEPQVLMADNEKLPFRMLSESVVGIPNRSLMIPEDLVAEEEGYFFVFAISIEQDRLTHRGQLEGETVILSQNGVTEVRFPGNSPLEFKRRQ